MSLSDTIEASILDHFFGLAAWTAPTAIYVAASTADPGEDGSTIAEPSDDAYARVSTGIGSDNWTRTASSVVNDNAITFPEATEAQGTITHFALYTAITAGTFLGSGALDDSQAVGSGETLRFAAGELEMTLT